MNPRATLALFLVTLLAVGGLFYLRKVLPDTRASAEQRRYALVFDQDDIGEIDIVRGSETLSLRREGDGWRMMAPLEDRASPEVVDRLLSAARFLDVRDRQSDPGESAIAEAGLASPRLRIDLRGDEPRRIEIGGNGALPEEVFARTDGRDDILRVPASIVELATAAIDTFRDPRLTPTVADDIEKFTVRRADGEMTVRRERGRWMIDKPVTAPADGREVRAFLEPLLGLRIVKFQAAAPEAAGLPGQTATVSMTPLGGGESINLEVIRNADENAETLVARFPPRGGLLEVDAAARRVFDISPEGLRDRSLGYVEPDAVDRITVESSGKSLTLQREGEGWIDRASSRTFDAEQVEELIRLFNEARATSFQPGLTAETGGLTPPAQRLVFSAWLSENTAEDSAGGHPIAGVELGSAAGNDVYARVRGTDEIVTLPPELSRAMDNICSGDQAAP